MVVAGVWRFPVAFVCSSELEETLKNQMHRMTRLTNGFPGKATQYA
jgi:hypothetical protein